MAQFGRPASTVSSGTWAATGAASLHAALNETSASDSEYITSADNTSPDTCEVALDSLSTPATRTSHVVRWRWRKENTGGHQVTATMRVMEGTTTIATDSITHPTSDVSTFATKVYNLSSGEMTSIGNYGNLRLQFERTGDTGGTPSGRRFIEVSWAELEIPDAAAGGGSKGIIVGSMGGIIGG